MFLGTHTPKLDDKGRPKFAYGRTIHEHCPRRAHFDAGQFVESFDDEAARKGWCLYEVGCKGPETFSPCPIFLWNSGTSWPIGAGHPCIGCTEPFFWDTMTPFYNRLPNVAGLAGFGVENTVDTLGASLAVGAAAAAAARDERPVLHLDRVEHPLLEPVRVHGTRVADYLMEQPKGRMLLLETSTNNLSQKELLMAHISIIGTGNMGQAIAGIATLLMAGLSALVSAEPLAHAVRLARSGHAVVVVDTLPPELLGSHASDDALCSVTGVDDAGLISRPRSTIMNRTTTAARLKRISAATIQWSAMAGPE